MPAGIVICQYPLVLHLDLLGQGVYLVPMKISLMLIAAGLLSGCALFGGADEQRRKDWLTANASAPQEIQRAVSLGQIMRGMTKAEVTASWGQPCGYCYGTRRNSYGDSWEYNAFGSGSYGAGNGTYVFFDSSGRVTGWSGR